MITEFIVLSAAIKQAVDWIKRRWDMSDDVIQAVAATVGIVVASALGVDGVSEIAETAGWASVSDWPTWLDYGVTGVAMGLGSGFVHDAVKAVRS